MLITNGGTLVRTPVRDISMVGRNTQGVTLIRTGEDEKLVQIAPIRDSDEEEDGEMAPGESTSEGNDA